MQSMARPLTEGKRQRVRLGLMADIGDLNADPTNLERLVIQYADHYRDGNAGKWLSLLDGTSTTIHDYKWSTMDSALQWAEDNGKAYHYHTLLWSKVDFFPNVDDGYDSSTRVAREPDNEAHITAIMTRYKGRMYRVDVWNEALTPAGAIETTEGIEAYTANELAQSFTTAHSMDPVAKLGYNDFALLENLTKFDGAIQLIKDIRTEGGHVDFLGIQAHLDLDDLPTYADMLYCFQECRANGIEPVITELDIRTHVYVNDLGNSMADAKALQGTFTEDLMRAARDGGCKEVNVWGVSNNDTWIWDRDTTTSTTEQPLPFDTDWTPNAFGKALYRGSR
jgi:endo-1,4-beta-xylanase